MIFRGLATLAEVWLNGRSILVSDNMFLAHEIDVDLAGDNELVIVFRSLDAELARRKGRARWRTRAGREQCAAPGAYDSPRPR